LAITKPISAFFYGGIWLLRQDIYRTILPYLKILSQYYNNIPEFMKVTCPPSKCHLTPEYLLNQYPKIVKTLNLWKGRYNY